MTTILKQAAENRRDFLKATGLAGLMTLATTGGAKAEETAPAQRNADPAGAAEIAGLPRVRQILVDPPHMPEHEQVAKGGPKIVEITLPIAYDNANQGNQGGGGIGLPVGRTVNDVVTGVGTTA